MFITFEGIEGSGKTTQIRAIAKALAQDGIPCRATREPGGTDIGARIRAILLHPDNKDLVHKAELLMYMADRVQHVETVVRPALNRGETVLCDRYLDATLAYQGYGRGLNVDLLCDLHRLLLNDFKPDLTLLLDLSPEIGLSRAWRRIDADGEEAEQTRFEEEALGFHERVRAGYLDLARLEPERFRIVDAAQGPSRVQEAVLEIINGILHP
ncbi:MAG: dTMP kinase [Thermodesulfobacteriota bacterium]